MFEISKQSKEREHCVALRCTSLHTFSKRKKYTHYIAYFKKRKRQLKRLTFLLSLQFQYLLKILSQRSSILGLPEDIMSIKMCGSQLLAMTRKLANQKNIMRMIRMPLELYRMAMFQKR